MVLPSLVPRLGLSNNDVILKSAVTDMRLSYRYLDKLHLTNEFHPLFEPMATDLLTMTTAGIPHDLE